jgi:hypothetical protein
MMRITLISILILFISQSCIKNDPNPSWLEINQWQLNSNPNSQFEPGELTESITDVQVFVDNELVGVFELPCKVPILKSGESNIKLYPVILNNGFSATKKVYPFLEPYSLDAVLIQDDVLTISPQTQYYSNLEFWIEDFQEESTVSIIQDQVWPVTIEIANGLNGNKFGRITLDETNNSWVGYTENEQLVLPKGQDVYLEIDYHSTNRVTTGLLGVGPGGNQQNPNIRLNPQEESDVVWKKIYIDLEEIVSGSQDASYFELTFNALLDEGDTHGEINIDNIKVIHF